MNLFHVNIHKNSKVLIKIDKKCVCEMLVCMETNI